MQGQQRATQKRKGGKEGVPSKLEVQEPRHEKDGIIELKMEEKIEIEQETYDFLTFLKTGRSSCIDFGKCIPNRCCITLTSTVQRILQRRRFRSESSQTEGYQRESEIRGCKQRVEKKSTVNRPTMKSSVPSCNPEGLCDAQPCSTGKKIASVDDGIVVVPFPVKDGTATTRHQTPEGNRKCVDVGSKYEDCGFEMVDYPVHTSAEAGGCYSK